MEDAAAETAKQETDWKGEAWEILLLDRCVYTREARYQQGEDSEPVSGAAGGTPAGAALPHAAPPHTPPSHPRSLLLPQQQTSLPHALPACQQIASRELTLEAQAPGSNSRTLCPTHPQDKTSSTVVS